MPLLVELMALIPGHLGLKTLLVTHGWRTLTQPSDSTILKEPVGREKG